MPRGAPSRLVIALQYGNDVTSSFAFRPTSRYFRRPPRLTDHDQPRGGKLRASLNDVNFPAQCRLTIRLRFGAARYQKGNAFVECALPDQRHNSAVRGTGLRAGRNSDRCSRYRLSFQNPLLPSNPFLRIANLLATQYPTYHNPAITPTAAAFLLPPTSPYYPTAFRRAHGMAGLPLN